MNREKLLKKVAKSTGKRYDDVREIAEAIENEITRCLVNGETVKLHGFGIAQIKTTNDRMSKNPKTGEAVHVNAKRLPVFKFSPVVAEAMEKKDAGKQ